MLEKAIVFATRKHEGQKRRWGGAYIMHPLAVAQMLACAGYGETYQTVAVLHDVLEDTATTKEELLAAFGDEIADAVDLLTRRDGQSEDDYVERILTNKVAAVIKSADKIHNLWDAVYCVSCGDERTREQRSFAKAYIKKTTKFYSHKFNSALDNSISAADSVLSYTPVPDWKPFVDNGMKFVLYSEIAAERYEAAKIRHAERTDGPDFTREDASIIYDNDSEKLVTVYGSLLFPTGMWVLIPEGWVDFTYEIYRNDITELDHDELERRVEKMKEEGFFYDFVTEKLW